jgi:hypothetical protein
LSIALAAGRTLPGGGPAHHENGNRRGEKGLAVDGSGRLKRRRKP